MSHYIRHRNSIVIRVGAKRVGWVKGDTFVKEVRGSQHFLRDPRAIAIARESLEDAERAGAHKLEITDLETGEVYSADLPYFRQNSFALQRGFEAQLAMRLERWKDRRGRFHSRPIDVDAIAAAKLASVRWMPEPARPRRRRGVADDAPAQADSDATKGASEPGQLELFGVINCGHRARHRKPV